MKHEKNLFERRPDLAKTLLNVCNEHGLDIHKEYSPDLEDAAYHITTGTDCDLTWYEVILAARYLDFISVTTYKRAEITILDEKVKVYAVTHNEKPIGFIEKDSDFGWIFYKDPDSEWILGLETLKECKNEVEVLIKKGKI